MPVLRLIVESSINEARNLMEPDFSMRSSSLNMPLQTSQHQSNQILSQAQYFENEPSSIIRKTSINTQRDFDFEEIGKEEQKSTNILDFRNHAVYENIGTEASTDVNNLVNLQNFGTNTNSVGTDEKQLNAVVDTKDCGSQIYKDVREAFCDGSIQTESKGSQFKTEAVSQEVNCQILRPEENEEEEIVDDEGIICFKCDGTKINKRGLPCRRCNGSGTLKNKFYQDLVKVVKDEIQSYTTQTFQRLMVDYLGKRAAD